MARRGRCALCVWLGRCSMGCCVACVWRNFGAKNLPNRRSPNAYLASPDYAKKANSAVYYVFCVNLMP